jgi:hypothetical protein
VPEAEPIPSIYPVNFVGQRARLREVDEDDLEAAWARRGSRTEFFRILPIEQPTTPNEERVWLASIVSEARAVPRRSYQRRVRTGSANAVATELAAKTTCLVMLVGALLSLTR